VDDLVALALRHAPGPGTHATPVAALQIIRRDQPSARIPSVHRPSLCFIAQGAKEVVLGTDIYRYAGHEFLFTSVDLPVSGAVVTAAPSKPYLCLVVAIEPRLIFDLVTETGELLRPSRTAARAIFVGQRDPRMSDAFLRLVRTLDSPAEARVLASGVLREITYRLLASRYGDAVRSLGIADSQTHRIAKVIERLKQDFARPLRTAELARIAGMSVSSFHQHFKSVTTLSPHQYQQQLRLQEARRLLAGPHDSAAEVGFRVGYESPSQFSREYARLFGLPPSTDAKRMLGGAVAAERRTRAG
jgi:AraC-like DNA-binding protein